jgi:hypothetical protein
MQLTSLVYLLFLTSKYALAAPVRQFFNGNNETLSHAGHGSVEVVPRVFDPAGNTRQFGRRAFTKIRNQQFHATCKETAEKIVADIKANKLKLLPARTFPDEFSWKGGFYLTDDIENAEAFARAFLEAECKNKGGMVVIDFLVKNTVTDAKILVASLETELAKGDQFRKDQIALGTAIKSLVGNPRTVPVQDAAFTTKVTNGLAAASLTKFNAIQAADFLVGTAPFTATQESKIQDAVTKFPGLPALKQPFQQLVVLTDAGMAQLSADEDDITDVPIAK